jgi:hypothetical protein
MATSGGYCPDYTPLRASSCAEFLGCTPPPFSFLELVKPGSKAGNAGISMPSLAPTADALDTERHQGPFRSVTNSAKKPWIIGILIVLAVVVAALWLLTFKDFP